MAVDKSTGHECIVCVKAHNIILRDQHGRQVDAKSNAAHSVEILSESHKGDQTPYGNNSKRQFGSENYEECESNFGEGESNLR